MAAPDSPLSALTLPTVRRFIRGSGAIMMTAFFAVVYALASMLFGGMIVLGTIRGGYTIEILTRAASFQPVWDYPGLLIVAPWGVVSLPWFPTLAMIVVSIGVGIGMSVAVLLSVRIVRARRSAAGRPAVAGSVAGLTPAMISLVTLGACCSTTAAASAGVAVVAAVSGTTTASLILNNWFLGVFQMAVVWIALVAQELLLRVYGSIFGLANLPPATAVPAPAPKSHRQLVAGSVLRMALLAGGVTWSLAMVADWTTTNPFQASAATWFYWILEQQVVSFLAIFAAFAPAGTYVVLLRIFRARWGLVVRGLLAIGGLCLLLWVPPPAAGWGIEGFGNELAWVMGAPASWGAVAPVFAPGLALYLRWGLQYLLLSLFALAVTFAPTIAFGPLLATVGHEIPAVPGVRRPATTAEAPAKTPSAPADVRETGGVRTVASPSGGGSTEPP